MLVRAFIFAVIVTSTAFSFGDALAKQNRQQIIRMQQMIEEQNERIDGLTSLIEGLNASLAELKMAQKHRTGSADHNRTVQLIQELGKMIDEINRNYVSRNELKGILQTAIPSKKDTKAQHGSSGKLNTLPPAKLYSEGVRAFVKKRYDEAQKRFLLTAQKGYKPAASNYYLGEIAYYTKQYEDAIFYYKKSAGLYDQASYMDVLLLHTAISLDKTGQKDQARVFYENVIENYPGRKAASIARKRLKGV